MTFLAINAILRFLYVVLYFYFLPFLIIGIIELSDDPALITAKELLDNST